jgi:hypothetical protein
MLGCGAGASAGCMGEMDTVDEQEKDAPRRICDQFQ